VSDSYKDLMNKGGPVPGPPYGFHRLVSGKPYFCTYCGVRLSTYCGRRAEWEGCPNCYEINTVELAT